MKWGFFSEIGRKLIHMTILAVIAFYVLVNNRFGQQTALLMITALLVIFLALEYFRLEIGWKMPFFSRFIRPKEEHRMYGVIYFLSGTIICLAVFDFPIAIAALLMTTFGDTAAALAGKRYGTSLIFRNKTLVGFVAGLLVNLAVGIAVSLAYSLNIYIPIMMAIAATFTETLLDEMDDNLIIPIFAGFAGQLLKLLF